MKTLSNLRLFLFFLAALGVGLAVPLPASVPGGGAAVAHADGAKHGKRKHRKKRRRRHRGRSHFHGHAVSPQSLRTAPVPKPSGDIWIYAVNFHEEVKVNIYDQNGDLDDAALAKLDHIFRCKRTGDVRAVDPRLYVTLSTISDHFGKKQIDLVSGFRFQQNEGSRHFHASAMDIRIPGVSVRELYEYATSLDTGGMGIGRYPRAHFVHIDRRAPGAKSYRWVDTSSAGSPNSGKRPSRAWHRKKPTS
ncbi:MAG TPA: DUF882 domain-containing protein [Kofleriaceae bacterium]|nr:DUF882 domain-containing protein [Kofleriaceae bacterium]